MHGGAPTAACETVNVLPAMVSVPLRDAPVFAATVNVTDPLPTPLAPVTIVSHGTLLTADQLHPPCVETATGVPAPPVATTL